MMPTSTSLMIYLVLLTRRQLYIYLQSKFPRDDQLYSQLHKECITFPGVTCSSNDSQSNKSNSLLNVPDLHAIIQSVNSTFQMLLWIAKHKNHNLCDDDAEPD